MFRRFCLLVFGVLASGCAGGGGSGVPACAEGDVDCYLSALHVSVDGVPATLREIPASALASPAPSGTPSAGGPISVWAAADAGPSTGVAGWDGWTWVPFYASPNSIHDVFAISANDAWAVGDDRGIARWDGASWTAVLATSGTGYAFRSVWAAGPDEAWIVGDSGTILRWNGLAWVPEASGTPARLNAVWGTGADDIWAVGEGGVAIHRDATGWTLVDSGAGGNELTAVWGPLDLGGGPTYFAGGINGAFRTLQGGASGAFTQDPNGVLPSSIQSIWGIDDGPEIWVTGGDITGVTFVRCDSLGCFEEPDRPLDCGSVWGRARGDRWVSGPSGFFRGGPPWTAEPAPATYPWSSLHGLAAPPSGGPPQIVSEIPPMTFDDPSDEVTVTLDWTDPSGCRPAFCFQVCQPSVRCSNAARCTPQVSDGLLAGSTILTLGYRAEPAGGQSEEVELEVTPVSDPGCDADPLDLLEAGDPGAVIGDAQAGPVTIVGPPSGGGNLSVATQNATCLVVETQPSYKVGNVVASGTVSGPVGSSFHFAISNGGQSTVSFDCGGWTPDGTLANNIYCINEGGPESVTWSVTQEVFWCTASCNPDPAENNSDLPVKYTRAKVTLDGSEEAVEREVTCP